MTARLAVTLNLRRYDDTRSTKLEVLIMTTRGGSSSGSAMHVRFHRVLARMHLIAQLIR